MADVRPPDTAEPRREGRPPIRPAVPQSFQTRLTFAFMGVVALTLALVSPVVINRLDEYFRLQEEQSLAARANASAIIIARFIEARVPAGETVVAELPDGEIGLNDTVRLLIDNGMLTVAANYVAQADIEVAFGLVMPDIDGQPMVDTGGADLVFTETLAPPTDPRQAVDPSIKPGVTQYVQDNAVGDWGMIVRLTNPYTSRASTLAAITLLLLVMASIAFLVAVLVAAFLAHRFTTPLTRLTEASRRLAEGDLASRVASDELSTGTLEIRELSQQFNAMADRLEESVAIIRRDRDYSRDFAADVSHELRTPIAAMKMHIELLLGPAGHDDAARAEFLHSSAEQLDRLDWLAQNLLELSKLDSGLVLLELRPEDVRGTIESAVEQQGAAAERKGITLTTSLPDRPVRIRHDPPRIGQVVSNLVGNAVKFTPRGGEVHVVVRQEADGAARIEVLDTGVGIAEGELPMIFDRFFRGSEANEARSTGSGLGLAIVKSIVDMHHGSIAVESRVGNGTRFLVELPKDPREVTDVEPPAPDEASSVHRPPPPVGSATAAALVLSESSPSKVDDSSPGDASPLNPGTAQ